MKRKEFIITFGRGFILTSLAGLTGYSLIKIKNNQGEICEINPSCGNCNKFSECKKPQAIKERKDEKE